MLGETICAVEIWLVFDRGFDVFLDEEESNNFTFTVDSVSNTLSGYSAFSSARAFSAPTSLTVLDLNRVS